MKPNRPRAVNSTRNYITVAWEPCDSLLLTKKDDSGLANDLDATDGPDSDRRWYVLEQKDRISGWKRVYTGFQTQTKVGPLSPSDYFEFRLQVKTKEMESSWSDILYAVTKDDVLPSALLHRVVENGPVATLRKILNQRPPLVDVPNKFGRTPLDLAILRNNTNFMGILLSHGASPNAVEQGSGRTPLMTAASKGFPEAVQLLLEKGSSWQTTDRNGLTAFNYAVDNSNLETVELAVEGSPGDLLKTKDSAGWSPLMRGVVLKASTDVLSRLLDAGSDPNECDDESKQTVLMQAVVSGRPEVIRLLMDRGADVGRKNVFGHSAYDLARHSFNEAVVKMAPSLKVPVENNTIMATGKECR